MSAPAERTQTTLADRYRDRGLSDTQVRRMVALLRLTDTRRTAERKPEQAAS